MTYPLETSGFGGMNGRANGGGYGGYDVNPYATGQQVSKQDPGAELTISGRCHTWTARWRSHARCGSLWANSESLCCKLKGQRHRKHFADIAKGGFGGGKTPNPYAGTAISGRTPATGWAGSGGKTPGWAGPGGKTPAAGGFGAGGRTPAVGMGGAGGRTPASGFGAAGGRTPGGFAGGRTPNPYAALTPATGSSRVS